MTHDNEWPIQLLFCFHLFSSCPVVTDMTASDGGDERGPGPRAAEHPGELRERDFHQERAGVIAEGGPGQEPGVRSGAYKTAGT